MEREALSQGYRQPEERQSVMRDELVLRWPKLGSEDVPGRGVFGFKPLHTNMVLGNMNGLRKEFTQGTGNPWATLQKCLE